MDILIFAGQSNMQGETEGLPACNEAVENAWEYRFETDSLVPVAHPVGEDLGNELLMRSTGGCGSLVPDFCRVYTRETGRKVLAIHTARGNTRIDEWQKGTDRYECALQKIRAGMEKAKTVGTIDRIYYIWLQGESDAIKRTTEDAYVQMLKAYKDDLKNDVGIEKFGIIKVGYFCGTVTWITDRTREEGRVCDEVIMAAQERIVKEDSDFVMLTRICREFSLDPQYINPFAQGHYNNAAMTIIGTEAAKALAQL